MDGGEPCGSTPPPPTPFAAYPALNPYPPPTEPGTGTTGMVGVGEDDEYVGD